MADDPAELFDGRGRSNTYLSNKEMMHHMNKNKNASSY